MNKTIKKIQHQQANQKEVCKSLTQQMISKNKEN